MSEDLKTIKELADEWGITKQTIQYHIKFLPTENRQKNDSGITVLTLEEQRIIKKRIKRKDKNKQTENRQKNDKKQTENRQEKLTVNSVLLEQVSDLKEQNNDLRKLLDQQQRLSLQDKKLLEEYKSEINELKALKMPQEDKKEKDKKENQSQEEVQTLKKQMEALNDKIKGQEQANNQSSKKWYQFWK